MFRHTISQLSHNSGFKNSQALSLDQHLEFTVVVLVSQNSLLGSEFMNTVFAACKQRMTFGLKLDIGSR